MENKKIYCLDCDDKFIEGLKLLGFDIISANLGYTLKNSQLLQLKYPPNECDV